MRVPAIMRVVGRGEGEVLEAEDEARVELGVDGVSGDAAAVDMRPRRDLRLVDIVATVGDVSDSTIDVDLSRYKPRLVKSHRQDFCPP